MDWLPKDLPSFIWGMVTSGLIVGILRGAGQDIWRSLKQKLFPPPLPPIKVDSRFEPVGYEPDSCVWVREERLYENEKSGHTYYPHPQNGAKCYRETGAGQQRWSEFLMLRPKAKKATNS